MKQNRITILIPSLNPDQRLVTYIKALKAEGFLDIVVVDDGSGEAYKDIFDDIKNIEGCKVIHHSINQGKGRALKTGYAYLQDRGDSEGIVTVDADGQHHIKDVRNIANKLLEGEKGLILGMRNLKMEHVPFKSRAGNTITTFVFWMLYGQKLPDTQTGLRGFSSQYLSFMQDIKGERFEYEMNVLIACSRNNISMVSIPIDTIYENDNKGTHFRAVKDAAKIYKIIFENFLLFSYSSIASFLIDLGLFYSFNKILPSIFNLTPARRIALATILARIISAAFNFLINKNLVFEDKSKGKKSLKPLVRYVILALGIMTGSSIGVIILDKARIQNIISKIIVDLFLYAISYRFQQRWVFSQKESKNEGF